MRVVVIEDRFLGKDFEEVIYQSMHHQMVASARAVKMCHEMVPGSMVGCSSILLPASPRIIWRPNSA